jgi:hypothetical protein
MHTDTMHFQEQVNTLEAIVQDQVATIIVLENRVVGSGFQLGDFCFHSFDDLLLWLKKNLPVHHQIMCKMNDVSDQMYSNINKSIVTTQKQKNWQQIVSQQPSVAIDFIAFVPQEYSR